MYLQFQYQAAAFKPEPADLHIKPKNFHQVKLKKYMVEKVLNDMRQDTTNKSNKRQRPIQI